MIAPLRRSGTRRDGFTLVEIMIALAITSMIALAVAAMLSSVSMGIGEQTGARRISLRETVVSARLRGSIRSARMVLDLGPDALVLWTGDVRDPGQLNLSELRRIHWDRATGELWSYAAPDDLSESHDDAFDAGEDFDAATRRLMDKSRFPGELMARNVTAWWCGLDTTYPQDASLVRFVIRVERDGLSETTSHSVALRSR